MATQRFPSERIGMIRPLRNALSRLVFGQFEIDFHNSTFHELDLATRLNILAVQGYACSGKSKRVHREWWSITTKGLAILDEMTDVR